MSNDDALLRHLGRIAAAVDPVPAQVQDLGRETLRWYRPDDELAALVDASEADLAGVRSGPAGVRLFSFLGGGLEVDVQTSPTPEGALVVGQVSAAEPAERLGDVTAGRVEVETLAGARDARPLDAVGNFRCEAVPAGLVRFRVAVPGGSRVVTEWFRV